MFVFLPVKIAIGVGAVLLGGSSRNNAHERDANYRQYDRTNYSSTSNYYTSSSSSTNTTFVAPTLEKKTIYDW